MLCVGGASVAGLVLGNTANITGAVFAVLVLTPLALADVLGGIPAAAQLAIRVRASLGRVQELLDSPEPVTEPATALPLPDGPRPGGRSSCGSGTATTTYWTG